MIAALYVDPGLPGRFWPKVEIRAARDCWLWRAYTNENGYGCISVKGRPLFAHRVAWTLANGYPGDLCVCHACDNPSCVNPNHLFLGTKGDNNRDMWAKGRGNTPGKKGETNPASRLTESDVKQIKARLLLGESQSQLARQFSVNRSTVHLIAKGKRWAHVR